MCEEASSGRSRPRLASESGALGLVLLAGIALLLLLGFLGYRYLTRTGERLVVGAETMDRGIRHLTGLEYMHPFTPPEDDVVEESRAAVFATVTREAYASRGGGLARLDELDRGDDRPGLGSMADGVGAVGEVTVALGEALSEHDMALSEYLWTGLQLLRGESRIQELWHTADPPPAPPPAVVELAARHQALLDEIVNAAADSTSKEGSGLVYWMGWAMASQSPQVWESPGVRAAATFIDSLPSPGRTRTPDPDAILPTLTRPRSRRPAQRYRIGR